MGRCLTELPNMNLTRPSIDARTILRRMLTGALCAAAIATLAACGGDDGGSDSGSGGTTATPASELRPIDAPAQNTPTTRCAP